MLPAPDTHVNLRAIESSPRTEAAWLLLRCLPCVLLPLLRLLLSWWD